MEFDDHRPLRSVDDGFDEDSDACEGCDGSGIRCPAGPSCYFPTESLDGWTIVERCDLCEKYDDDLSAASKVFREVRWIRCAADGDHAIGRDLLESPNRASIGECLSEKMNDRSSAHPTAT
jgi:hypothetical protein